MLRARLVKLKQHFPPAVAVACRERPLSNSCYVGLNGYMGRKDADRFFQPTPDQLTVSYSEGSLNG